MSELYKPNRKITDRELMDAIERHPGMSNVKLGELMGVSETTIRKRKAWLAKHGWSPEHDMTKEVPEGYKLKGISSYYVGGKLAAQWVKTSEDRDRQYELMQEAIEALTLDLPKVVPTTIYNEHMINDSLMAVYPLGDPHVGMLSWDQETGDSWDLKIAEQVFLGIFDRAVKSAPRCKKGLIVNLGDFFHRNNAVGTTDRSGHHLDCDGRYAKMVHVGMLIMRRMITSALEHHEVVEVWNIPGNHDDISSMFMAISLRHIYENESRVIINDSPALFQYCRFGKNLIGSHHGHTCKMDKLPSVMACDRAKEWGETEYRYWLTGHIHHDSKKEFPGCIVESFRTLAAKDNYAMGGGWRSGRDTKVIVYHKEYGEVERHTISLSQMNQPLD